MGVSGTDHGAGRRDPRRGAGATEHAQAHLNAIGTAVPPHDVHEAFIAYVLTSLRDERTKWLFERMVERSGISRRRAVVDPLEGFYAPGAFPDTAARMRRFERDAPELVAAALDSLEAQCRTWRKGLTHLVVTCCTGFYAPGLDLELVERFGLEPTLERTLIGFMGCNAAFNALKLARHAVRSDPDARVLVINLELCSLHLQEISELDKMLMFLLFADGCAASLVSAEPSGLALDRFASGLLPDSRDQITWHIGMDGFDMRLSGRVPRTISRHLPVHVAGLLGQRPVSEIELWAVHPGGRSILDAVQQSLGLGHDHMAPSRAVLRDCGNMSSAAVMFVLARMMARVPTGRLGCAMGFGPGLSVESLLFREAA